MEFDSNTGRLVGHFIQHSVKAGGDYAAAIGIAAASRLRSSDLAALQGVYKGLQTALSFEEYQAAFRPVAADLSRAVAQRSVIGRMGLHRVPTATRLVLQTGTSSASFVAEGAAATMSRLAFANPVALMPKKVVGLSAVTTELVRSSKPTAAPLVADDLIRATVLAADAAMFDPFNGGDSATPASVLFGAPNVLVAGSTAAEVDAALLTALNAFGGDLTRPVVVTSRARHLDLALMRSGGVRAFPELSLPAPTLLGMPVFTTSAVRSSGSPLAGDLLAVVDADAVALAQDEEAEISTTGEAAVQLSSSPAGGAAMATPLWQSNLIGIRATLWITWDIRKSVPAVYLSF